MCDGQSCTDTIMYLHEWTSPDDNSTFKKDPSSLRTHRLSVQICSQFPELMCRLHMTADANMNRVKRAKGKIRLEIKQMPSTVSGSSR